MSMTRSVPSVRMYTIDTKRLSVTHHFPEHVTVCRCLVLEFGFGDYLVIHLTTVPDVRYVQSTRIRSYSERRGGSNLRFGS